jgi:glucose/arabinose dehydrogenase
VNASYPCWARIAACSSLLALAACEAEAGDPPEPKLDPETIPSELALSFVALDLGLDATTDFAFVPEAPGEIFVTTHPGVLHRMRIRESSTELLESVTIPGVFYDEGCGVLSMALDPAFGSNGLLYLGRCDDTRTTTLARYHYDGSLEALPQTEAVIMRIHADADPPEDWHRWGSLGFEEDGETMWALLGDLFERQTAQDVSTKSGSLLRFKPSRALDGEGFEAALGNLAGDGGTADPAVYAYGFRSPFRGTRDARGRFWVGDVGLHTKEEVNVVTRAGQNFGWDRAEGRCEGACDDFEDPVVEWGRTSSEPFDAADPVVVPSTKRSAWVGDVYEAPAEDRYYGLMKNRLVYGDHFTGWVRALDTAALDTADMDDRHVGHLAGVVAGRVGPDGYLYLLTVDGALHRAVLKR